MSQGCTGRNVGSSCPSLFPCTLVSGGPSILHEPLKRMIGQVGQAWGSQGPRPAVSLHFLTAPQATALGHTGLLQPGAGEPDRSSGKSPFRAGVWSLLGQVSDPSSATSPPQLVPAFPRRRIIASASFSSDVHLFVPFPSHLQGIRPLWVWFCSASCVTHPVRRLDQKGNNN